MLQVPEGYESQKPDSPDTVMWQISEDLKSKGLTHAEAAKKLGYKNKQTLSNLLSSKKYMSKKVARRFIEVFGYDEEYLTSGIGELYVNEFSPEVIDSIVHDYYDRGSYYDVDTSKFRIAKDSYDYMKQLFGWVQRVSEIIGQRTLLLLTDEVRQYIHLCGKKPYDAYDKDGKIRIRNLQLYGFISIERLILKLKEDMKEGRIVVKDEGENKQ